jgi:hypothetical protein
VTEVARRTAVRIERVLGAGGRSIGPEMHDANPFSVDEPTLAAYYAAAAQGISVTGERAGKPTLRLIVSQDTSAKVATAGVNEPVADVRGVSRPWPRRTRPYGQGLTNPPPPPQPSAPPLFDRRRDR